MNSQDPDWELKNKSQYNWLRSKLEESTILRDKENKVDWIFVLAHKPLYAFIQGKAVIDQKENHNIYQPLFDQYQVDFVLRGRSYNMQRTLYKYGGLDQEPIVTESALDFSHGHGQIYIVSGAAGRILYQFEKHRNRWTAFAYDKGYGYHVFVVKDKQVDVYTKSNGGHALEQFTVTRGSRQIGVTILSSLWYSLGSHLLWYVIISVCAVCGKSLENQQAWNKETRCI